MKGLELSVKFYEEYGKKMLRDEFADVLPYIAVGLCGQGSECMGFDDDVSRDHDFEPGFMIFLPGEDKVDRRRAFLLERAYTALPKEFCGVKRLSQNPVGGARHGVFRTAEYFLNTIGTENGELPAQQWLLIPGYILCEATNGEIFEDNFGEVTKIREKLLNMPEDIIKKRLAGRLIAMAQAGQYNYKRCLLHGEAGAAQISIFEFAKAAMDAVFILNRRYMPFYKWQFRALRQLPVLGNLADDLEALILADNSKENAEKKEAQTETVCAAISKEIAKQGIAAETRNMEQLAYAVNDGIKDSNIRSMSIFC
ncbi:MAG: DUF4037 domain-containing protein [Clostridia bacterium]|nr:DUF4037 domain-containing protein [Clostridia bacterium]